MDFIIVILLTLAVGIVTALYFLNKQKPKKTEEVVEEPERRVAGRPGQRLVRANHENPARNRLRNRIQARNVDVQDDDVDDDRVALRNDNNEVDYSDEDQEIADREELRKKIGTKKLAKLEEKAEKKRRNEEMLKEREEKKEREELEYEKRKQREQEEERLEKEKEEQERLAKEEVERKEHEEYLKLKEQFTVDEEGQDTAQSESESQNLLLEFVNYIKDSKIVVLEDLAAEFKLKTQDVINRINMVQEMGLLTGVMDDRGKFIYISEEELLKVKRFIEQRGRINITELAVASGELINLKPVVTDSKLIEPESI